MDANEKLDKLRKQIDLADAAIAKAKSNQGKARHALAVVRRDLADANVALTAATIDLEDAEAHRKQLRSEWREIWNAKQRHG